MQGAGGVDHRRRITTLASTPLRMAAVVQAVPDVRPGAGLSCPGKRPGCGGIPLGALREREFRLYFTGQLVSLLGDAVTPFALAWAVLDLTGPHATSAS